MSGVDDAAGNMCQALFLGFRGGDGAPVFAADVTGAEAAVRSVIESNPTRPLPPGAAIVVKDAKAVGPEMRHNDAGLLAAAGGLLKWQARHRFCSCCGARNTLVKAGHTAVCSDAACAAPSYPLLMPAVLTLCTCGDYTLLAGRTGSLVHCQRPDTAVHLWPCPSRGDTVI